jgi:hypothetical protein
MDVPAASRLRTPTQAAPHACLQNTGRRDRQRTLVDAAHFIGTTAKHTSELAATQPFVGFAVGSLAPAVRTHWLPQGRLAPSHSLPTGRMQ